MLNNPKLITIVGDSLAQVSGEHGITYQDTYPYLLQTMFDANKFLVNLRSNGGNHMIKQSSIDNLNADILFNNSEYIVIHLGIVDCAPRLFRYKEDKVVSVLSKMPIIKTPTKWLIKFKSKHRRFFTKYFKKTYVPLNIFRKKYAVVLDEIRAKAKPKKLVIVNIADTSDKNKYRSYGFEKNITDYNEVIKNLAEQNKDFCQLVDFNSQTRKNTELIMKDEGIHLTKEGHKFLAKLLFEKLTS